jgi:hypothetical protein
MSTSPLSNIFLAAIFALLLCTDTFAQSAKTSEGPLHQLTRLKDFQAKRVSSYDSTGGNADAVPIDPGKSYTLAEIKGPAAISHLWCTISAEPFYSRKLILRIYWDDESEPSVEAPIGDFFGVGHGVDRNYSSLPFNVSSLGRARNCFFEMPFAKSARLSVTNEGNQRVGAFYYYVDYRVYETLLENTPYFHAQYRQEMPCKPNGNYLIIDAKGQGHYVGCNLSVLQRAPGWWGEGDDMIYIDGETKPTFNGTGSEDYFCDAWGMREAQSLFYGCPLQEEDYEIGSKATVYRFHIPDPIPFRKSIRVTIEHGTQNDRADFFSSVGYWYQIEPHSRYAEIAPVDKRLPFAYGGNFARPVWKETKLSDPEGGTGGLMHLQDSLTAMKFSSKNIIMRRTSYYGADGNRYRELDVEGTVGETATLQFQARAEETYNVALHFKKSPSYGKFAALCKDKEVGSFDGYASDEETGVMTLRDLMLAEGTNVLTFKTTGKNDSSSAYGMGFMGMTSAPSRRVFAREWYIIGPFDSPKNQGLKVSYPPESEIALKRLYTGKDGKQIEWHTVKADSNGLVDLAKLLKPNENVVAYGITYVYSPAERQAKLLVGSDDGVKVWMNGKLVHENPMFRGAIPDQDIVTVSLNPGWNEFLVKVDQGGGGWGFHFRIADAKGELVYSPEKKR